MSYSELYRLCNRFIDTIDAHAPELDDESQEYLSRMRARVLGVVVDAHYLESNEVQFTGNA
jgi:hypothetical protein